MALNIIKNTGFENTTYYSHRPKEFIVIHYTAGVSSKKGAAMSVANMFKNSKTEASADFIIDDEEIVQFNADIDNRYCWSVGGNKYTTLSTKESGKYYAVCRNANSISIELCSSKKNKKHIAVEDKDWYFTDAVLENAYELVHYLMDKYDIDLDHVICHAHVTGKWCPAMWFQNNTTLKEWHKFKDFLSKEYYKGELPKLPQRGYFKYGDNSKEVKKLKKFLKWCGYKGMVMNNTYGNGVCNAVLQYKEDYGVKSDTPNWGKGCNNKAKTIRN